MRKCADTASLCGWVKPSPDSDRNGDSVLTLLEGSEPLHSDMVLLAIGVTPDARLWQKKPDSNLVFVAASL